MDCDGQLNGKLPFDAMIDTMHNMGTRGTKGEVHFCTTRFFSICKGLEIRGTRGTILQGANVKKHTDKIRLQAKSKQKCPYSADIMNTSGTN